MKVNSQIKTKQTTKQINQPSTL